MVENKLMNTSLNIKSKLNLNIDYRYYAFFTFFVCLIIHFGFSLVGWENNILHAHGFRQSQTAISVFYTLKEGFSIEYLTPVFGSPWSIPMEFPTYQWIVATVVLLFDMPLEQAGRLVSLTFFYLCLFPIYALLKLFVQNRFDRMIILGFILMNPVYLFWSRTFMIESMALFFSLSYLWAVHSQLCNPQIFKFVLIVFFGVLASLTKVTTFLVYFAIAIGLCFMHIRSFKHFTVKDWLGFGFCALALPLGIGYGWVLYADYLKSLNPLAVGITSTALKKWNFGTIEQRLSLETWVQILWNASIPLIFGKSDLFAGKIHNFIIFCGLAVCFLPQRRKILMVLILLFLIGPLVFTNLYFIHNYYLYANSLFLSILLGYLIISLNKDLRNNLFITAATTVLLLCFSFTGYYNIYLPNQKEENKHYTEMAMAIKKLTKETDVILIYGLSWDSSLPYSAERKAIMDTAKLPVSSDKFQRFVNNTGKQNIKAIVAADSISNEFLKDKLKFFDIEPQPLLYSNGMRLYTGNINND